MAQALQPSAVIFVINTLDKSVFDLLKMLKDNKKTAHIPVLASSPHWRDSGEDFFTSLGFNGILKQPLELTTLSDSIRSFVTPLAIP
jgi:response regulator RpfG family c-di-GMP phosphodiesterase